MDSVGLFARDFIVLIQKKSPNDFNYCSYLYWMIQNLADIVAFGNHQDHSCIQEIVDFVSVCLDKQRLSTVKKKLDEG